MGRSIYQTICENIENGTLKPGFGLPSEKPDGMDISFAAGAMDGMCMYHMAHHDISAEQQKALAAAIDTASAGDFVRAEELLRDLTCEAHAVELVDAVQGYISVNIERLKAEELYKFACGLVTESESEECVKVGLEIIEMFGDLDEEIKDAVRTLALSDEFTLYCVWCMRGWENGSGEVFAAARKVRGWGRIHAVRELKPDTAEIRRWLLAEGIDNDIMEAYSAYPCWIKSGAADILRRGPNPGEYRAIARLISALLDEGPVSGISMLGDREEILLRFMEMSGNFEPGAEDFSVIMEIAVWAEDAEDGSLEVYEAARGLLLSEECTSAIRDALRYGEGTELSAALMLLRWRVEEAAAPLERLYPGLHRMLSALDLEELDEWTAGLASDLLEGSYDLGQEG